MTGPITIRKGGQSWDFPADLDGPLDSIIEMAPLWGCTIGEEVPASIEAARPISKGVKPMRPKEVIKRATDYGDVDRATLQAAIQKRADKEVVGSSATVRLGKYLEQNREARLALDAAPAPAQPIFKTSHAALMWQREQHMLKAGLVDAGGERDGVDPAVVAESDKALVNVAQGLIDGGYFSGPLRQVIAHLKTSPRYGALAASGKNYKDVIREMMASR